MGVGQLSESDAVDALRLPFYSSSHPTGSHGWRNQFDLGNPDLELTGRITGELRERRDAAPEPAIDAIIKLASALTEAQLRGMAAGDNPEGATIDVEGHVVR